MAEAGNTPVILATITASDVEHSEQRKAIAIAAAISVTAPMPSIVPEPSVSGDSAVRTMDAAIVPDSRIGHHAHDIVVRVPEEVHEAGTPILPRMLYGAAITGRRPAP